MSKGKPWGKVHVRNALLTEIKQFVGPNKTIGNPSQFTDLAIRKMLDELKDIKK
jgi:hypothetical protein